MTTRVLAAVAALMLFPAPARAGAPVAWQYTAKALAETVFRPACGPLAIVFEDASRSHAGFPGGPAVAEPTGWAREGECVIHLDRAHPWLGYPELCHVVLHEAGNVVGYGDDWSNPRSIRYPLPQITRTRARVGRFIVTRWEGVDRRCLTTRSR